MKPINSYAASTKQVTLHACEVLKIDGNAGDASAASGIYLQVHDSNAAPAAGAVPLKVWPIYGGAGSAQGTDFYKTFRQGDLTCFLGCWVGVSSTEATYTASANPWAALSVELSDPELPASVSFVGDLTTAVTGLQVFTEASGTTTRQSLVALEVDGANLTTATQFIQFFCADTVSSGDVPIQSLPIAVAAVLTGEKKFNFGEFGRNFFSIDSTSAATKRYGLTIKISSTPNTFTACTGTAAIKAEIRSSENT